MRVDMRIIPATAFALYLLAGDLSRTSLAKPAKCVPAADPEVWMLKTSGTWTRGKRYGYYRAIVLRKGIEHAMDQVQVQLLEADDKTNSVRVVTCVDLDTPGLKGYVTDLDFEKIDDTRMAVGIDIEMKAMNNIVLREVFLVDATGAAKRLVKADYVEIE